MNDRVLASVARKAIVARMSEAAVIHIIDDDEFDTRGARQSSAHCRSCTRAPCVGKRIPGGRDPCGFRRRENLQREPKSRFPRPAASRLGRFLRRASLCRAPLNGASQRGLGGLGQDFRS